MSASLTRPANWKARTLKIQERAQIEAALERRFLATRLIPDEQGRPGWTDEARRKNRLSKALAAYTVSCLCSVSEQEGVNSLVDGEEDNGIDAIYVDGEVVYLVQAKYKPAKPDRDEDIHPFVQGARDMLDGEYGRFRHPLFTARQAEIEAAVSAPGATLVLVFVHLSEAVEYHALTLLEDFCAETDVSFRDINGQLIHAALLADESPEPIRAVLTLEHQRHTTAAPKVAFGLIRVRDLAELYHDHGARLFDQNIRSFLGRTALNREIEASLRSKPELFVHYNNGITMICQRLTAPKTSRRLEGRYSVQGLSIVNGAQTVGSIAHVIPRGDPNPPDARVLVTIIETHDAGDTFAVDVTRTRNTQNPIPEEAFAAQDSVNERLRERLALYDVRYVYKPGQDRQGAHCTLEDVANALAMFSADPADALTRNVTKLLDVRSAAYARLFGPISRDPEPERLYRMVQVFQQVEQALTDYQRATVPKTRERQFYSSMRPLIRCWIARRTEVGRNSQLLLLSEAERATLSRDIETYTAQVLRATLAFSEANGRGIVAISNSLADGGTLLGTLIDAHREAYRTAQAARASVNPL